MKTTLLFLNSHGVTERRRGIFLSSPYSTWISAKSINLCWYVAIFGIYNVYDVYYNKEHDGQHDREYSSSTGATLIVRCAIKYTRRNVSLLQAHLLSNGYQQEQQSYRNCISNARCLKSQDPSARRARYRKISTMYRDHQCYQAERHIRTRGLISKG